MLSLTVFPVTTIWIYFLVSSETKEALGLLVVWDASYNHGYMYAQTFKTILILSPNKVSELPQKERGTSHWYVPERLGSQVFFVFLLWR